MTIIRLIENNVYADKRGELIELKSNVIRKRMKHFFVSYTHSKSSTTRGNHYHNYKNEWFFILQGKINLKVKDLKSNKTEEYVFTDELKKFIHIKPKVAHSFRNIGKNELILLAIVDRKFDKKKPDTYKHVLEQEK